VAFVPALRAKLRNRERDAALQRRERSRYDSARWLLRFVADVRLARRRNARRAAPYKMLREEMLTQHKT